MTAIHYPRTAPAAVPSSEYDQFLYASIAEEHNGTLLSVLSALARSNLDPWEEAARLARLPRAAARQFLATLIAATADGPSARRDPEELAEDLIALLPRARVSRSQSPNGESQPLVHQSSARAAARALTLYVAAVFFFLFVNQWLAAHLSAKLSPSGAAASATPAEPAAPGAAAKSPPPAAPTGD